MFHGIKLVVGMAYPLATARSAEDLYTCWSKCFLEDSSKGITKHTAYYYSFKGPWPPLVLLKFWTSGGIPSKDGSTRAGGNQKLDLALFLCGNLQPEQLRNNMASRKYMAEMLNRHGSIMKLNKHERSSMCSFLVIPNSHDLKQCFF